MSGVSNVIFVDLAAVLQVYSALIETDTAQVLRYASQAVLRKSDLKNFKFTNLILDKLIIKWIMRKKLVQWCTDEDYIWPPCKFNDISTHFKTQFLEKYRLLNDHIVLETLLKVLLRNHPAFRHFWLKVGFWWMWSCPKHANKTHVRRGVQINYSRSYQLNLTWF